MGRYVETFSCTYCFCCHQVDEADRLFRSILSEHKVMPTTPLYNAIIKGHAEAGNVESSYRLFNDVSTYQHHNN